MQEQVNKTDRIPEMIYSIAAVGLVMSGNNFTDHDQSEPDFVSARIKIKRDIYEELKNEGLDINTIVNKLLSNFLVAYKTFWGRISGAWCSGRDLNPGHGIESPV